MKKNIIFTISGIIIAILILVVGLVIGLNAEKIFGPKYEGPIIVNVEMKETQKNKLVQKAYDYLKEKGLIEEYGIKIDDPVTIKKNDDYSPRNLGSLTSTWNLVNLSVYVIDFNKGDPVVISQSTEDVLGLQIAIIDWKYKRDMTNIPFILLLIWTGL